MDYTNKNCADCNYSEPITERGVFTGYLLCTNELSESYNNKVTCMEDCEQIKLND